MGSGGYNTTFDEQKTGESARQKISLLKLYTTKQSYEVLLSKRNCLFVFLWSDGKCKPIKDPVQYIHTA